MKVICVHLRKGGSGKTTTAVNLAAALANLSRSVLLVDLDQQANASQSLGVGQDSQLPTITSVLSGSVDLGQAIFRPAGQNGKAIGFSLIPSDTALAEIETTMASNPAEYAGVIKQLLAGLKPAGQTETDRVFDYVLLDTPPGEGMLAIVSLVACDLALLPVQTQFLALNGLALSLDLADRVKQTYGADFAVRLLPTMTARTNISRACLRQLQGNYADILLDCDIPASVRVSESQLAGRPISDHHPRHKVSKAFARLAKLIDKLELLDK